MSNPNSSEIELSREESQAIWRALEERMRNLDRCRAVFDVEISEAYRALRGDAPEVPARCRIVYQRAGEHVWQVSTFDEHGTMLSDLTCDGAWIEAGGKCWDHRYSGYAHHEPYDERDGLSEEEEDRIEAERDTRRSELSPLLWPQEPATGHLLACLNTLTIPLIRNTWRFSRESESGRLICRSRYNYEPTEFRFSTWEYLRWRIARLWRSDLDIMEYYGKESVPLTEVEFVLNESCGCLPERLRATDRFHTAVEICPFETWEDPVSFNDGLNVPRIHRLQRSSADGEVLRQSTLVPEESSFGVNIPLSIRPIDRTKERVDW